MKVLQKRNLMLKTIAEQNEHIDKLEEKNKRMWSQNHFEDFGMLNAEKN